MRDANKRINELVADIRNWFTKNAPNASAVLGISGGKDSTITAALLARALGKERVIGVMMPNGKQSDINDSYKAIDVTGIKPVIVNIGHAFDALKFAYTNANDTETTSDADVNLQPRLRMAALYMVAQSQPNGGIVINTCNRSEDYIGYATKFGDCAGDMSVLGNLFVSEIIAIGDALEELPYELVHKAPSDGLWGDTDEDRIGFTYDALEKLITTGSSGNEETDAKIRKMHKTSRHKYSPMYICGAIYE